MHAPAISRRILVAADDLARPMLRRLLQHGPCHGWDVKEASSFEQARFLMQMDDCDLLLLDESLLAGGDSGTASWLAARVAAPLLLLTDPLPEALYAAGALGGYGFVSRTLAWDHPVLLHAALLQATQLADLRRTLKQTKEHLQDCRERIERLVGRLWECSPSGARPHWFSQRYMLERLQEEVARAGRHGGPLTIALGELVPSEGRFKPDDVQRLASWTVERISRFKRRSDVAGQWGPATGFMLVLPGTSASGASGACQRLRELLEEGPSPRIGPDAAVMATFGLAAYTGETSSAQSLLSRAEESLERARAGETPASGEPSGTR